MTYSRKTGITVDTSVGGVPYLELPITQFEMGPLDDRSFGFLKVQNGAQQGGTFFDAGVATVRAQWDKITSGPGDRELNQI